MAILKTERVKIIQPRVVDLGTVNRDRHGYLQATLLLPDVPHDKVEAVGHACALAILGVMNWPEDEAEALAERVRANLADKLRLALGSRAASLPDIKGEGPDEGQG